jgi:hypothetical protein
MLPAAELRALLVRRLDDEAPNFTTTDERVAETVADHLLEHAPPPPQDRQQHKAWTARITDLVDAAVTDDAPPNRGVADGKDAVEARRLRGWADLLDALPPDGDEAERLQRAQDEIGAPSRFVPRNDVFITGYGLAEHDPPDPWILRELIALEGRGPEPPIEVTAV